MNIKQAKQEVKNTIISYLSQDELGRYDIEPAKQRPIFLMGPPGIGKTAIIQQVAEEMDIALISYSMTHHTRQSALGLPRIKEVSYQGKPYVVSEYTMSEIIASVYDTMEASGKKKGILFLDEINCVSETLSPIMLQFLQFKTFGMHAVPEGWVVVTAGNPPEYNNSVHEFDVVTWDRLKRIDVETDFDAWKEFAYATGVHAAVISFLENKQDRFYTIKNTIDGKQFVTARGWDDLSRIIHVYEKHKIPVTETLVRQYLHEPTTAKEFAVYYDLFNKYRSDYQINDILAGKADANIKHRAKNAGFDESYALISLLLDAVTTDMRRDVEWHDVLLALRDVLRPLKGIAAHDDVIRKLTAVIGQKQEEYDKGRKAKSLSADAQKHLLRVISLLEDLKKMVMMADSDVSAFGLLSKDYEQRIKAHMDNTGKTNSKLSNAFHFCDEVYPNGHQIVILVKELAANPHSASFLGKYENPDYFNHDRDMLFAERSKEIRKAYEDLMGAQDLT